MCAAGKFMNDGKIYDNDIKSIINYAKAKCKIGKKSYTNDVVMQGLGTSKDLYKIESGETPVEKFEFDRILHRLGVCADIVEILITDEDWERYCDRMQIYEYYYEENYREMENAILSYKEKTKQLSRIHKQFAEVMQAKMMFQTGKDFRQIFHVLKSALELTVVDWEEANPEERCLAPEELEIIILMARCYRKQGYHRKAMQLLEWVKDYSKTHVIQKEIRCRFMPLAYLEISKLHTPVLALEYVKAGILLLYCSGYLFHLIPLQNEYLALLNELEKKMRLSKKYKKGRKRIREERDIILELCKEVKIDWRRLEPIQTYKNAYLLSEMLYRHRTYWGQSQSEFCEGVCSEVSYSKIEKGKTVPKRKFKELMERMGYPGINVIASLHGTTKEYMDEAVRIKHFIRCYQYKEADEAFKQLLKIFQKKRLIENCPRNKQFFVQTKAVLDYELGRISIEEERKQLEFALKQTIPEYPKTNLGKKPLLWQEAAVLNNIANTYMECKEKDYEKAARIWEDIRKSYQESKLYKIAGFEGYDLIQTNYASCIGSSGDYARSTQLGYENIRHFLKEAEIGFLERECYGIAWNREQEMKQEYGIIKKETACQKKLRQAEVIADMIKHIFVTKFLKEHKEKVYGNNVKPVS